MQDTLSEESESDAETCMTSLSKPLSVQSKNKFSKTCITNKQKKSVRSKIIQLRIATVILKFILQK